MSDDQDRYEWVSFLLVPAYPGSPGSTAAKRLCVCVCVRVCECVNVTAKANQQQNQTSANKAHNALYWHNQSLQFSDVSQKTDLC